MARIRAFAGMALILCSVAGISSAWASNCPEDFPRSVGLTQGDFTAQHPWAIQGHAIVFCSNDAFREAKSKPSFIDRGLTASEWMALENYTGTYWRDLNAALRGRSPDATSYAAYVGLLDGALSKLPRYDGVVYRGTKGDFASLGLYKPGAIVSDPAYLSTSSSINVAENFREVPVHGVKTVRFVIHSKNGRNLAGYGQPGEAEILFGRNERFRVLRRTESASVIEIEMDDLGRGPFPEDVPRVAAQMESAVGDLGTHPSSMRGPGAGVSTNAAKFGGQTSDASWSAQVPARASAQ